MRVFPMGMTGLGGRIYQARLDFGARRGSPLSQAELGQLAGVSQTTVANWEADRKEPNLDTIARLAEVLGTSPEYLAFGVKRGSRHADPREEQGRRKA